MTLRKFTRDRRGAVAMEYAFIAMFIAIAAAGGIRLIGPKLSAPLGQIGANLS